MRRKSIGGNTACVTVVVYWKACVGPSVAMRRDVPREMLQWTPVLARRKIGAEVPSILAQWTTVLEMPALWATVLSCQKEEPSGC